MIPSNGSGRTRGDWSAGEAEAWVCPLPGRRKKREELPTPLRSTPTDLPGRGHLQDSRLEAEGVKRAAGRLWRGAEGQLTWGGGGSRPARPHPSRRVSGGGRSGRQRGRGVQDGSRGGSGRARPGPSIIWAGVGWWQWWPRVKGDRESGRKKYGDAARAREREGAARVRVCHSGLLAGGPHGCGPAGEAAWLGATGSPRRLCSGDAGDSAGRLGRGVCVAAGGTGCVTAAAVVCKGSLFCAHTTFQPMSQSRPVLPEAGTHTHTPAQQVWCRRVLTGLWKRV